MHYLLVTTVERLPDPRRPESFPRPHPKEEIDFYAQLGVTIASWQFVENALYRLYIQVLQQHDSRSQAAAFFCVPSFRGRLSMTDAAIEHSDLKQEIKERWKKLCEKAIKRSRRRNAMAHGIVVFEPYLEKGERLYLRPDIEDATRSAIKAFPTPPEDKIGVRELQDLYRSFGDLNSALVDFAREVFGSRTPCSTP